MRWSALVDEIRFLSEMRDAALDALSVNVQREAFSSILAIMESSIDILEKKQKLQLYLSMHFVLANNSCIDYFLNPNFPINRAILLISQWITLCSSHEHVLHVLNPTIQTIEGLIPSGEGRCLRDYIENDGFSLYEFLPSSQPERLIHIQGVLDFAKEDPARLFSIEKSYFSLTALDLFRLRHCAGEASQHYFDALKNIYFHQQKKLPSLGYAIEELASALLRGSKIGSGSEEASDLAESEVAIANFYAVWRALSNDVISQSKDQTVKNGTISLQYFILTLFSHCEKTELALTEQEQQYLMQQNKERQHPLFPCAHQIGEQLQLLLANNTNLYVIPMSGYEGFFDHSESNSLPNATDLAALSAHLSEALKKRDGLPGESTHIKFLSLFQKIIKNLVLENNYFLAIPNKELCINEIDDAIFIFKILPENRIVGFINKYKELLHPFLDEEHITRFLQEILSRIENEKWISIFSTLCADVYVKTRMNGAVLGELLYILPTTHWLLLYAALKKVKSIFSCFSDVKDFLAFLPQTKWQVAILTFSELLAGFFNAEMQSLSSFLISISEQLRLTANDLSCLLIALRPILFPLFEKHSLKSTLVELVKGRFHIALRKSIVENLIISYADALFICANDFFSCYDFIVENKRQFLLNFLNEKKILSKIFNNYDSFNEFISHFTLTFQRDNFLKMISKCGVCNFEISAKQFVFLCRKNPESVSELSRLFKCQLVIALKDMLTTFECVHAYAGTCPISMKDDFMFLITHFKHISEDRKILAESFEHRFEWYKRIFKNENVNNLSKRMNINPLETKGNPRFFRHFDVSNGMTNFQLGAQTARMRLH